VLEEAAPALHALDLRPHPGELALHVQRVFHALGALQDLQKLRLELALVVDARLEIDEFLAHVFRSDPLGAHAVAEPAQRRERPGKVLRRHPQGERDGPLRVAAVLGRGALLGAGDEATLVFRDAHCVGLGRAERRHLELERRLFHDAPYGTRRAVQSG
jgi:hypothetical protein